MFMKKSMAPSPNQLTFKPANTMVSTSGSDGSDFFGKSVAISDSTIAVGAPGDDSAGNVIVQGTGSSTDNDASGAGAAYVFNRYCQGNYEEYSPLSCLSGEGIRYNICRDGEVFSYDICPDVVNTSFEWLGRILTISSLDFNGSDRRVQFVERGESVTLRLQGNVVSTGSYCPGCVIQFYTGLFGTSTSCLGSSSVTSDLTKCLPLPHHQHQASISLTRAIQPR